MAVDHGEIHALGLTASNCSFSASCAVRFFAKTTSPDVSRSMRWTTMGPPFAARPEVQLDLDRPARARPAAAAAGRQAGRPACRPRAVPRLRRRCEARSPRARRGAAFALPGRSIQTRTRSPTESRPAAAASSTSVPFTNTLRLAIASAARPRDVRRDGSARNLSSRSTCVRLGDRPCAIAHRPIVGPLTRQSTANSQRRDDETVRHECRLTGIGNIFVWHNPLPRLHRMLTPPREPSNCANFAVCECSWGYTD